MYFEERMIDGIMHYRSSPNDDFIPYDIRELSRRYSELQDRVNEYRVSLMRD